MLLCALEKTVTVWQLKDYVSLGLLEASLQPGLENDPVMGRRGRCLPGSHLPEQSWEHAPESGELSPVNSLPLLSSSHVTELLTCASAGTLAARRRHGLVVGGGEGGRWHPGHLGTCQGHLRGGRPQAQTAITLPFPLL